MLLSQHRTAWACGTACRPASRLTAASGATGRPLTSLTLDHEGARSFRYEVYLPYLLRIHVHADRCRRSCVICPHVILQSSGAWALRLGGTGFCSQAGRLQGMPLACLPRTSHLSKRPGTLFLRHTQGEGNCKPRKGLSYAPGHYT